MAQRPSPFEFAGIRCTAIRGPRSADGLWYWRALRRADGESWQKALGWLTRDAAQVALARLVADGADQAPPKPPEPQIQTVADLVRYWRGSIRDRHDAGDISAATKRSYLARSDRIRKDIGDVHLTRLDSRAMESYRTALSRRLAPLTVRLTLRAVSMIWEWGRRMAIVPDRSLHVPTVKAVRKRERYTPTLDEARRVVDAVEATERTAAAAAKAKLVRSRAWQDVVLILRVQAATGMRIGEACSLTWASLNLRAMTATVQGKTGERVVPLPLDLVGLLRGLNTHAPLYSLRPTSAVRAVLEALDRLDWDTLGIPRFTTHGFRRMAVNALYASGVDPAIAAEILGHSAQEALRSYRQVSEVEKAAAMSRSGLGTGGDRPSLRAVNGERSL